MFVSSSIGFSCNAAWPGVVASVLLLVASCGGQDRHRASAPPMQPAAPAEAAEAPSEPAADALVAATINVEQVFGCAKSDLALRVMRGDRVQSELVLEGECAGACTEEEVRQGEATLAELEALIAAGEASDSELDYNFTECIAYVTKLERFEDIADRRVALLAGNTRGPHDVPAGVFQLATERCGEIFVSQQFGTTYTNFWSVDDLMFEADADAIVVRRGVEGVEPHELYRVTLPADCAAAPVETVANPEPPRP